MQSCLGSSLQVSHEVTSQVKKKNSPGIANAKALMQE